MLSRVAESLFWINRYIERAENYSRFIHVNFVLALELPEGVDEQWEPLVLTTGDSEHFYKLYPNAGRDNVIEFLCFDKNNGNSILSCLETARENARGVRDFLPQSLWRNLNEFYISVNEAKDNVEIDTNEFPEFLWEIQKYSNAFYGALETSISHDLGYNFSKLGQTLERADKTTRILDMKYFYLLPTSGDVGSPLDLLEWSALLRSTNAFEIYRQLYGKLDVANIVSLLLLHEDYPRSVYACLQQCQYFIGQITGSRKGRRKNAAEKTLGRLLAEFEYDESQDIFAQGLHEYLDATQGKLNALGEAIADSFF